MSSHSNPTRTLPYKPSLAQLRKQTKELLRACQAREALAIIEVEQFERNLDPAKFTLADAMRVLARAYGFSSWNALKNHVESLSFSALIAAAEAGDVAAVERLAMANPKLFKPHLAEFRDSALHRAVLRRDEKLTCALMQLGADARKGFWPHREATSAYSIAVDREYREIVATMEGEEAIRRERLRPDGDATSAAIDDVLAT